MIILRGFILSYLRIRYWAVRSLHLSLLWGMVLVISCSLIFMGGLIWIDNSWAIIPDGDPATSFESSVPLAVMTGEIDCDDLDPDGDGQIPLAGGTLLQGNGDQDDNKTEPWRIIYRLGEIIELRPYSAPVVFREHRVVSSYLDFGHLKVFPDAVLSLISENIIA